jgi:hypothetical protein
VEYWDQRHRGAKNGELWGVNNDEHYAINIRLKGLGEKVIRAGTRSQSKTVNQGSPLVRQVDDEDEDDGMDHKHSRDLGNMDEAAQYEEEDDNTAPNLEEIAELESIAQVSHEHRKGIKVENS